MLKTTYRTNFELNVRVQVVILFLHLCGEGPFLQRAGAVVSRRPRPRVMGAGAARALPSAHRRRPGNPRLEPRKLFLSGGANATPFMIWEVLYQARAKF